MLSRHAMNIAIDYRWPALRTRDPPELATELVTFTDLPNPLRATAVQFRQNEKNR